MRLADLRRMAGRPALVEQTFDVRRDRQLNHPARRIWLLIASAFLNSTRT